MRSIRKERGTGRYLSVPRDIRIQIADKLGYDSYTDYAYDVLGRDYTPEDAHKFSERVRTEMPLALAQMITTHYDESLARSTPWIRATVIWKRHCRSLKLRRRRNSRIKMTEALDYMQNNKLYDFSAEPNKNARRLYNDPQRVFRAVYVYQCERLPGCKHSDS